MLSDPKFENSFDRWEQHLAVGREANPDLISQMVQLECARLGSVGDVKAMNRIRQLLDCRAWIDLALALIQLELPQWKLRRLIYDDGEWHCSLSRHLGLPAEIDETADASHPILPLAILATFVQARCLPRNPLGAPRVPRVQSASRELICCDNFR